MILNVHFVNFIPKLFFIYSGLVIILNNSGINIGSFINENIQQDVSITFEGIVFGHYESDSTKSNSCFIRNVIFFFVNFTFTNVNLPTENRIFYFFI